MDAVVICVFSGIGFSSGVGYQRRNRMSITDEVIRLLVGVEDVFAQDVGSLIGIEDF